MSFKAPFAPPEKSSSTTERRRAIDSLLLPESLERRYGTQRRVLQCTKQEHYGTTVRLSLVVRAALVRNAATRQTLLRTIRWQSAVVVRGWGAQVCLCWTHRTKAPSLGHRTHQRTTSTRRRRTATEPHRFSELSNPPANSPTVSVSTLQLPLESPPLCSACPLSSSSIASATTLHARLHAEP